MNKLTYNGETANSQKDVLTLLALMKYGEAGKIPVSGTDGYEKLDVTDDAAVGFASIPSGAGCALISLETEAEGTKRAVRFLSTGEDPTTTDGFPLNDGDIYEVSAEELANIKFIATADTVTHVIHVMYYESIQ